VILRLSAAPVILAGIVSAQAPVRPQDDLHRFANAEWLATNPLSAERVTANASTALVDQVEQDLRALIEGLAADDAAMRRADVRQAVNLYASMMNQAEVERRGLTPLGADLARIDGIQTTRDFAAVAGYLSSIAGGGPFEAIVSVDAANLSVPIVRLLQGGTLLPDRSYYLSDDPALGSIRREYQKYLVEIFRVAGRATPEADAAAVLELETRLAMAQSQPDHLGVAEKERAVPFLSLGKSFPGFDWNAWAEPQGVHRAPQVVFAQPSFFLTFAAMVPKVPLGTWRAWLAARYLTAMSPFVMSRLSNARFEFFGRIVTGQEAPRPPWKRAVSLVSQYLGDWIGRRYVERHFPAGSRDRVTAIAREVVAAYRDAVREAPWMSSSARGNALRQLSMIELKVGYPDRWRHYNGLEFRPDDLMGNITRGRAYENRYRMERLQQPRDLGEWLATPQTVNAYYSPVQHDVVVPAGILQPPYFSALEDDAVNYGAIGAVIGHEVSHAIDLSEFKAGMRALELQANSYEALPGLRMNVFLTQSEALADLSGLAIAHRAYRRSLRGKPVPGGGDERFFTAWARIWRVQSRPEYVRSQLGISRYPPWEFRANGMVQHLDAFHEAFGVKPGDALYREPAARVRIW
jgi:predicted metalloendopeptidase